MGRPRTHYDLLGVPATASIEQIHRAYRTKCKTLHPDIGGDVDRMATVNAAYTVLSDQVARSAYDEDLCAQEVPHPAPQYAASASAGPADGTSYNFPSASSPCSVFEEDPDSELAKQSHAPAGFHTGYGRVLTTLSTALVLLLLAPMVATLITGIRSHSAGLMIAGNAGVYVFVAVLAAWCIYARALGGPINTHYLCFVGVTLAAGIYLHDSLFGVILILLVALYVTTAEMWHYAMTPGEQ